MIKIIIVTILAALTLVLSLIFPYFAVVTAEKISCKSFKTQKEANAHYEKKLDRDQDGLACENLPLR